MNKMLRRCLPTKNRGRRASASVLPRHPTRPRLDAWAWAPLDAWIAKRVELPVGPLFCVIDRPTRGRACSASAVRAELRRHAAEAGVRPRFAPHQPRHARAVELASEGVPLRAYTSSYDALQRGSAQALRLPQGPPRPRRARSAHLPRIQPKPDRLPAARPVQQPRQPARGCLIRATPKRASKESSSAPSGRSRCSYGTIPNASIERLDRCRFAAERAVARDDCFPTREHGRRSHGRPVSAEDGCWFGTPTATRTDTATAARPPWRSSTLAAPT